jgi:hypothetical protein
MSRIIALCIEDCHPASGDLRFLRCCALTGLQPGLALTPEGIVEWRTGASAAVRLVVSLDEKLVCYREATAPGGVRVHRGGRFVEVEPLKPVVLLDGDELSLGARRLRLHVHGFCAEVHSPEYYVVPESSSSGAARVAAVAGIAVAGLLGVAGCDKPPPDKPVEKPPIDVRDQPPAPLPPPPPPMEVRDQPPVALPPEEPPPPPPMEPVMEPVMEPPPIEMRPHPPVKPIPRPDDRPRSLPPSSPGKPQP